MGDALEAQSGGFNLGCHFLGCAAMTYELGEDT